MNITCTAPGTLPSSTGPAVSHNYIERSLMEAHSPITIWQSGQGQHSSQIPSVSVKQEPMDVEHNSRSPNNDSGISPGHGSSGSSAGRPSPGQTTSFGSPEHYDVNSVTTTPYSQQQHAPVWGINVLAQPHGQIVTSPSGTEHPQTPRRTPTSSPRLNSQPPQAATTLPGNRSPIVDRSMASPIQNVESAMHTPTRGIAKSPPVPESNSPPGLNASLSDENSRSSSGSNTSLPDGENEYYQSTQQISDQSPLRCLEMTVEHSSMLAGLHTLGPGVNSNGARNVYQCPLCDYNTLSRIDFNNHNISHCPEQKCRKCDFVTKDMAELRNHLREVHMISPLAEEMETTDGQTGIAVPRINSQGKVKTFRCKQCSFVSVTKVDFWAHSRTHIRKEKLLNCPRCPFVTEYKHHLEYHLRNHANSKPFQCYKCQYSCVNKSMLNSHLKSHSTVYQYRCASCNYATKYCHSLKLHLRKYRHQPAMVLNPDGSPNPNPIIDVYGTRRGPKPRLQNTVKQPTDEKKSEISLSTHAPLPLPIFPGPYAMIPQQHGEHQFPYPYSHLIPSPFPSKNNNNPLMPAFPQNGNVNLQEKTEDTQDDLRNFPHVKYENFMVSSQYYHTNNNNNNNNIINGSGDTKTDKSTQNQGSSESYFNNQVMEEHRVSPKTPGVSPLDLSKPDVFDNNVQVCDEQILSDMPQTTPVMAKSSTKHRRKGQAYKLDHISRKLQQQCLTDQDEFNNSNVPESEGKPTSPNKMVPHAETQLTVEESVLQQTPELEKKINQDFPKSDAENKSGNEKNSTTESNRKLYHCTYCEITYSDAVLYTMHKGYHGFQDPFKCNMCGEQTADKVEFFVHIARSSHC